MSNLRDWLLGQLTAFGLRTDDVEAVLVPVDDPRVAGGELRLSPADFAAAAARVDVADARQDIMLVVSRPAGGYDEAGTPIGPARRTVYGFVGGTWIAVRGDGAQAYPFSADDLRRA